MNEELMRKATFSEICRIMEHKDGIIRDSINSIVRLSILLFPEIATKNTASLAGFEAGMLNVDVKDVIDTAIISLKSAFKKPHQDFISRSQDAQIAQVLIVFAAYFDSIKMYLPDAHRSFEISANEKYTLTQDSIDDYINYLNNPDSYSEYDEDRELTDFLIPMANPIDGFDASIGNLEKFYELLNARFLQFVEKLSYLESIPNHKQDHFYAVINNIPRIALNNYKKQYYELSAIFPDFFVWTTQEEHAAMQHCIDVGFSNISKKFSNIAVELSESAVKTAFQRLQRDYDTFINKPIVSNAEMPLGEYDIRLPNIETCFIPQSFHAGIYRGKTSFDNSSQCVPPHELGRFIADTLRSPEVGIKPMLILGDPGAGKTMLCHMLAAKILKNEYNIIIIHLRNIDAESEIFEQINQQLRKSLKGFPCSWGEIENANLSKPVLLIFDGYDELLQASGKTHSNYLEKIAAFQEDAFRVSDIVVRTIVTSRIVLINKAQIPCGSPIIFLDEFDEKRINLWTDIWNHHNSSYFSKNGTDPFCVTPKSNAWQLAKQPLLLLMLALFDSNANALRQHQDLSVTKLYNSLINDFIERELKKDPAYNQKTSDVRKRIIDEEIDRLCIAALGMYNRNRLYIQSDELQKDLIHFASVISESELLASDKLLGSFFFIHRSDAISSEKSTQICVSAYEFLHNTFGEFLTAHYIVKRSCIVLNNILQLNTENKHIIIHDSTKWYTAMSYTPLFQRPVVAEMIEAWAPIYFRENGLPIESIVDAVNYLLDYEMPRILQGIVQNDIETAVSSITQDANYPNLDSLTRLAIYSNNFISLIALLLDGLPISMLDKYDSQAWSKCKCIWRYAFSEDDLAKFAACFFVIQRDTQRVLFRHSPDTLKRKLLLTNNHRPRKIFETKVSLGEELEYSALGMLYDFDYKTVKRGMERQDIPQKAWLAAKHIINQRDIFSSSIQNSELEILDDIFKEGMGAKNSGALFYGFLLLKFLTDPRNSFLHDSFEMHQYTTAGWLCFAYRQISTMRNNREYLMDKPLGVLILEILNQIPLDIDDCEMICSNLFPYKFVNNQYLEVELLHLARLGQRIISVYQDYDESIPYHLLDSYIIRLADTFERICKLQRRFITDNVIQEILQTIILCLSHCDNDNIYHLLMIYREYLPGALQNEDFYFTTRHASLLVHALSLYHQDGSDGARLAVDLIPDIFNNGISVVDLFDSDPNSILSLIEIIKLFPHDIGIPNMNQLVELVEQRADQISYGAYKQLLEIAETFNCQELYDTIAAHLG